MRKLTAIIMTMALVLTLTACNGGDSSDPMPEPQPNPTPEPMEIGDVFLFGNYNWRVLEIQGDTALIISEYVLEIRAYHAEDADEITWEHSNIRAYLNGEFYNSFSSADQSIIIETVVINDNNPYINTSGGNDTTDKIFLLSIDEVQTYFANNPARIALNVNDEASLWLLRSPGFRSIDAAHVDSYGSVDVNGYSVEYAAGGVRPAMWISLE